MKNLRVTRAAGFSLALLSAAAACVVLVIVVWAGAVTPGYSHVSQFISELGATDARSEMLVRFAGFLPAGLLLLAFCAVAFKALPKSGAAVFGLIGLAIYAAGYVTSAFFPCDPGCRPSEPSLSQVIHNIGGLAGYFLAPGTLFVLARAARDWFDDSLLVTAGYLAAALALIALLTLTPESPVVGLTQRLLELSMLGWVVLFGFRMAKAV